MQETLQINNRCHTCGMRTQAENSPKSLISRLWRWHTGWCPGWKAYLQELEAKGLQLPQV